MNTCSYHILPTIKNLLEKIVLMYKESKFDCYIWVFTHSIKLYMNESKEDIYYFLLDIFNKFTEIIFSINSNEILDYSHGNIIIIILLYVIILYLFVLIYILFNNI